MYVGWRFCTCYCRLDILGKSLGALEEFIFLVRNGYNPVCHIEAETGCWSSSGNNHVETYKMSNLCLEGTEMKRCIGNR